MNYGYIRVSSDKQTVENQRFEIIKFANEHNLTIHHWVEETISSREPLSKRKLSRLLHKLSSKDVLIATEISRLGRSLLEVMQILHNCLMKECQIWTLKENYRLGANIQSKVMAFAFGLSAEIERQLISARTKSSLQKKKADGQKLGRPKGAVNKQLKLTTHNDQISQLLEEGYSISEIAQICGVNRSTIHRYLKRLEKKEQELSDNIEDTDI